MFPNRTKGFTLVEIVAVIAILALIAVFAVTRVEGLGDRARIVAAEHDLVAVRTALLDAESGYLHDMRGIPGFSLAYLRLANLLISTNLYGEVSDGGDRLRGLRLDDERLADADGRVAVGCAPVTAFRQWDPSRGRGWRGPYVKGVVGAFPTDDGRGFYPDVAGLREPIVFSTERADCSVYGFRGEPALLDPWGNPYVLQIPPAQAFSTVVTNVPDTVRFRYARVVSAGPDGRLTTPCFEANGTNDWRVIGINWQDERMRRLSRQAGLIDGDDRSRRGDDLVLFLMRNDVDEGEE